MDRDSRTHHRYLPRVNINGAGVGILFITPTKDKLRYVLWIHFLASNNAVEYEACPHGLRIAVALGVKRLMVYEDSALVINQLKIRKLEGKFYGIEYHHVVRDQNQPADQLSKISSSRTAVPPGVFVQDLLAPSIKEEKEVEDIPPTEQLVPAIPSLVTDWRQQFIKYLTSAKVLADKTDTERLIHQSKHYVLVDGNLMRKSAKEGIL